MTIDSHRQGSERPHLPGPTYRHTPHVPNVPLLRAGYLPKSGNMGSRSPRGTSNPADELIGRSVASCVWLVPSEANMLWTLASFGSAVGSLFGYGLMISGAATCIWMPLSHLKPFESRRVFGVICAALALLTAGYKLAGAFGPKSAEAGPSTVVVQTPQPATAPAAQQVVQGSVWPDPKTGDRSLAAAQQVPAKPKPADVLSDRYVDNANGYSIQFPVGWSSKTFASGQP